MSVRIIRQDDPEYPRRLFLVERPPKVLYAEGDLGLLEQPKVAIIGSRHPSPYGIRMSYEAAGALAGQGAVVVSGMAIGLDARAHRGALDVGGGTIAVLGAGIDQDVPLQNRALLREVRAKGLVLSEYEPGRLPLPWMFPERNRIIAAISQVLLVVEGKAKGGTSNTAEWAGKITAPIFAVPGQLDNPLSTGPNFLIRDGALIYTHPNDILLKLKLPVLPEQREAMQGEARGERRERAEARENERKELTGAEAEIFDLIGPKPLHVDALAAKVALEPGLLLAALSSLELQGLVTQLPGKHFALAS
jgi:DNA processing protein